MADKPSKSGAPGTGKDPVLALRVLDRYEPLLRLAEGGMAEVYVARVRGEAGFETLVALKRMLPHLAEEPRFVDMFLDEARLAALVRSPNVVQTLDLGRAKDGSLFLVMELVLGVSVSRLQKAAQARELAVPPSVAVAIVVEAAAGLHDAHEACHPDGRRLDLVHRDVSPQNLLVDERGQVRVTDFGIARALERRTRSMSGEVKGKIAYFSPEQAAGEPVDRRTDVYALGVVAWELLAGRRLIEGADTQETLERLQRPIPPAQELGDELPPGLVEVVYRALEPAPEARFATADAFGEALRAAGQAAGVLADRPAVGAFVRQVAGEAVDGLRERIRIARGGDRGEESLRSDAPTRLRAGGPGSKDSSAAPTKAGKGRGKPSTPVSASRRGASDGATGVIGPRGGAAPTVASAAGGETGVAGDGLVTDGVADPRDERTFEDPATWRPSSRALRGRGAADSSRPKWLWITLELLLLGLVVGGLVWWRCPGGDRERGPDGASSNTGRRAHASVDAGTTPARRRSAPSVVSARPLLRIGGRGPRRFRGGVLARGLYEGMLRRDSRGRWVNHVVVHRPSLSGRDARLLPGGRLSVTWRFKPGMRWSDGRPLRAGDLVFGLQVWAPPELLKATAHGDHTVELLWRDRVAVAFRSLDPLPRHVLEPVFRKGGSEAVLELLRSRPVPGLGPYRVTAEPSDTLVVLEANPHYAGPPPSIRRVELHLLEGVILERDFLAGRLDLTLPNAVTLETAERIRRTRPAAVHLRPSNKQVILQPDLRHPLLAKRAVRQALLRAIDRVQIARQVYGRLGLVSHLPMARVRPTGMHRYDYAPKRARRELVQAGAAGARIPLFYGTSPTGRRIAVLVAGYLKRAGLVVELRPLTFERRRTFFRRVDHRGLLVYGLRGLSRWPLRHWWSVPRRQGRYLRTARHAALDDWVAALMEREARALDWRRRRDLRDQVWVAYSERLPHLPLVFATERILADPALRGWDFQAGRSFGAGIAHWYFTR